MRVRTLSGIALLALLASASLAQAQRLPRGKQTFHASLSHQPTGGEARLGSGGSFNLNSVAPARSSNTSASTSSSTANSRASVQPSYSQPQPTYSQPAYMRPAYQQPVYQQPAYQQPVYRQPTAPQTYAAAPVYQQPQAPRQQTHYASAQAPQWQTRTATRTVSERVASTPAGFVQKQVPYTYTEQVPVTTVQPRSQRMGQTITVPVTSYQTVTKTAR